MFTATTTKPPVDGKLVKLAPDIAGNVEGNTASGIVPELKLVAFKAEPSIYPAPLVIALLLREMFAEPSKATPAIFLAVVSVAADPVVFWFPAVLTPGKSIFADPSKLTPPILRAVASVAAVVAAIPRASISDFV